MDTLARAVAGLSDAERLRLAALDEELADRAMTLPPENFVRWLQKLVASVRDEERPCTAEQQRAASTLRMGRRPNGMWWLAAELDHERGAELSAAIEAAARKHFAAGSGTADGQAGAYKESAAGSVTATSRAGAGGQSAAGSVTANGRAAALHLLATRTGNEDASGARSSLGIGYVIDAQTLFHGSHPATVAQTWAGDDHDPQAIQRLACDSDCYAVVIDRLGHPDATGLARRAASREQRLALRALYRHCPLDGTPFDRCEIHHVNHTAAKGGTTTLDNLVPISVAWHHRIHDRGWTLTMTPDRSLQLTRPDGTHHRTVPPPQPLTRQHE
jgi:hypothetical protein